MKLFGMGCRRRLRRLCPAARTGPHWIVRTAMARRARFDAARAAAGWPALEAGGPCGLACEAD